VCGSAGAGPTEAKLSFDFAAARHWVNSQVSPPSRSQPPPFTPPGAPPVVRTWPPVPSTGGHVFSQSFKKRPMGARVLRGKARASRASKVTRKPLEARFCNILYSDLSLRLCHCKY